MNQRFNLSLQYELQPPEDIRKITELFTEQAGLLIDLYKLMSRNFRDLSLLPCREFCDARIFQRLKNQENAYSQCFPSSFTQEQTKLIKINTPYVEKRLTKYLKFAYLTRTALGLWS
jgi:hypothetical protein